MLRSLLLLTFIFLIASCTTRKQIAGPKPVLKDENTFRLAGVSKDSTYGYTPENPVLVGGIQIRQGPWNSRRYLNALAGPKGEAVTYERAGSCCPIEGEPGQAGQALLDHYRVIWEGAPDSVSLYLNLYSEGELKAPVGFTLKK